MRPSYLWHGNSYTANMASLYQNWALASQSQPCDLRLVLMYFFHIFKTNYLSNSLRLSDAYMSWQTDHHGFGWCLVIWTAPSHCLNQCWNIVNWILGNKLHWNFNWNSNIFSQENAFKMSSVKWHPISLSLNVLTLINSKHWVNADNNGQWL